MARNRRTPEKLATSSQSSTRPFRDLASRSISGRATKKKGPCPAPFARRGSKMVECRSVHASCLSGAETPRAGLTLSRFQSGCGRAPWRPQRWAVTCILSAVFVLSQASIADAAGVSPERASDAQKQAAQQAFLAGDAAFDRLEYEVALTHFRGSYDIVASPNSRLMIARCLLELRRLDEAYDEFTGVVADVGEGDAYRGTISIAKQERAALQSRLAWITIERGKLPKDATIKVAGRTRTPKDLEGPLAVMPGHARIEATAAHGPVAAADVHVAAGRKATIILELGETITVGTPLPSTNDPEPEVEEGREVAAPVSEQAELPPPAPSQSASLEPWAYIAGGVGLVGAGAFTAFGVLSGNHYRSLVNDCTKGTCPTTSQKDIDAGRQFQSYANIGLVVGVAGVATSAVLFLLDARRRDHSIEVSAGYRSLLVRGAF
jgi:hypothetical protein